MPEDGKKGIEPIFTDLVGKWYQNILRQRIMYENLV